jgi:hypothetical protein
MYFIIAVGGPSGKPRPISYIFDVLHMDDRQTLILMPHKIDDTTMIPHTFLHALPSLPQNILATYYKFKSQDATRTFLMKQLKNMPKLSLTFSMLARLTASVLDTIEQSLRGGLDPDPALFSQHRIVHQRGTSTWTADDNAEKYQRSLLQFNCAASSGHS